MSQTKLWDRNHHGLLCATKTDANKNKELLSIHAAIEDNRSYEIYLDERINKDTREEVHKF